MKTQLQSYDLWYDGDVVIKASDVETFITKVPSNRLFVNEITKDIKQFNALMSRDNAIKVKDSQKVLNFDWELPEYYKHLDVRAHLLYKLGIEDFSEEELEIRFRRVLSEFNTYSKLGLVNLLRCLIYVVDMFNKSGTVWGVGRGSSVASYVLYLIGVHDIDSVLYELPFKDFVKHE